MADWLKRNLEEVFSLPQPATDWLLSLWNIFQVFDDAADGDPIDRADLDACIWDSLAGFYQNPFFAQYAAHLVPLIGVCILKWQASDRVERDGAHNAMSYAWRAGYYDIVLAVVALCHGHHIAKENAHLVMSLYGETFDDYLAEFNHA